MQNSSATKPHLVSGNLRLTLSLIRCFNAAAFITLSIFYFGMFYLGKPAIEQVELVALSQTTIQK
ncbi:hypothetical protein RGU72_17300 [Undibacterium sp. 5I1]|uniref:hypothetical protein n=1 Tax=unclassified Undibacterium TaxID=2630295 RepID=UPI002AB3AFEF|nr:MULTISPECIES: hypothetical protein [unclassified Undibacterium]MDY7540012.1 hypothetical protein [Undibacterium sp. 5I1]MEB0232482.1 hypothetical protein [Undibacterium sp. 10I3]MEB0257859.1 hypothetical protein [Undibacterium sp. 5I1]